MEIYREIGSGGINVIFMTGYRRHPCETISPWSSFQSTERVRATPIR